VLLMSSTDVKIISIRRRGTSMQAVTSLTIN
jgi:hypothetical protein